MNLEESCVTLTYRISELRENINNVQLPHRLVGELEKVNNEQKVKLKQKLDLLCESSDWKEMGRPDLITNLSSKKFYLTQKQKLYL